MNTALKYTYLIHKMHYLSTLSISLILTLVIFFPFSNAKTPPIPKAFIFPINKDAIGQYFTRIQLGYNSTTLNLVINLDGKFAWFNSDQYFSASRSYRPIPCETQQCTAANGYGCVNCFSARKHSKPGCTNNTCAGNALNPFTRAQGYGGLGEDILRLYSQRGGLYNFTKFPFQYSDPVLLQGLSWQTVGMIGLSRARFALPSQLTSNFKISKIFTLCFPSYGTNGNMILGEAGYSNSQFREISKSLITTPLIQNPVKTLRKNVIGDLSEEYFINVKSIRIDNKTISFNNSLLSIDKKTGNGGTSIRTVNGYTTLHSSIYKVLVDEFKKAATLRNISGYTSFGPFEACFYSRSMSFGKTGPQVPVIDFVLQNENVYWRFYGSNSLVQFSSNAWCLAFLEEKSNSTGPTTSIVVGGYQMENYLLKFDLSSSRLGISTSLRSHGTSCSQF